MLKQIINIENKKKVYWLFQAAGWSGYILFRLFIIFSYDVIDLEKFSTIFITGLTGLFLTHFFRYVIKQNRWQEKSFFNVAYRLLISSIVMGGIMTATTYSLVLAFSIPLDSPFTLASYIISMVNNSLMVLIWSVVYLAVHFVENYERSEIERLVWEAAVKDFELKTLKSQLNPHFMFNALNSIRALVEENPERAKTAITELSSIFRYSLRIEKTETVPLEDEIKTVENYLSLEMIRYEERLNYKLDIDPATRSFEIPPMMIQTLVENGIKHGIGKLTNGGEVTVKTELKKESVHITIRNSGKLESGALLNTAGHGVSNTRQRLHLIYGEKASFNLENNNGSVQADIKIPIGGKNYESFNS